MMSLWCVCACCTLYEYFESPCGIFIRLENQVRSGAIVSTASFTVSWIQSISIGNFRPCCVCVCVCACFMWKNKIKSFFSFPDAGRKGDRKTHAASGAKKEKKKNHSHQI